MSVVKWQDICNLLAVEDGHGLYNPRYVHFNFISTIPDWLFFECVI